MGAWMGIWTTGLTPCLHSSDSNGGVCLSIVFVPRHMHVRPYALTPLTHTIPHQTPLQSVLCYTMDAWGGKTPHFASEYDTTSLLGPLERGALCVLGMVNEQHGIAPPSCLTSFVPHTKNDSHGDQAPAAWPPPRPTARGPQQARRPARQQGTCWTDGWEDGSAPRTAIHRSAESKPNPFIH